MCLGLVRQSKQSLQEKLWWQSDFKIQLGAQVAIQCNVLITV